MSSLDRTRVLRQRPEKKENVSSNKVKGATQYNSKQAMKEVDDSLVPEKVIGALKNENLEIFVIVKWKNKEGTDVVPASIANHRWPNLVIRYYEQRIRWIDV